MKKIIIVGGGAAGFFSAICCKTLMPNASVKILERSNNLLSKVKISGGGRCNVTNACFSPQDLIRNYPRGGKELYGPFQTFNPIHIIQWFEERGIMLKTEADNRIFPENNSSQTIIDCFTREAASLGIEIATNCGVTSIETLEEGTSASFCIHTTTRETIYSDYLLMATGSSFQCWEMLKNIGHSIQLPIPSLFTFRVDDSRISTLAGVSINQVTACIPGTKLKETGPLLITHRGLSAPVILRLSAWGARVLAEKQYYFPLVINFMPEYTPTTIIEMMLEIKRQTPRKQISTLPLCGLPARLWKSLFSYCKLPDSLTWADASKSQIIQLAEALTMSEFMIIGKNTFKEEFVTCGGVTLKEVDFRTMESKVIKNLFFAGEVLDIDAITGGFNFQAAWTTSFIAAQGISKAISMQV